MDRSRPLDPGRGYAYKDFSNPPARAFGPVFQDDAERRKPSLFRISSPSLKVLVLPGLSCADSNRGGRASAGRQAVARAGSRERRWGRNGRGRGFATIPSGRPRLARKSGDGFRGRTPLVSRASGRRQGGSGSGPARTARPTAPPVLKSSSIASRNRSRSSPQPQSRSSLQPSSPSNGARRGIEGVVDPLQGSVPVNRSKTVERFEERLQGPLASLVQPRRPVVDRAAIVARRAGASRRVSGSWAS